MKHSDDCLILWEFIFNVQFMREHTGTLATLDMNKENKYWIAFSKFLNTCLLVLVLVCHWLNLEIRELMGIMNMELDIGSVIYNNFQSIE